MEVVLICIVVQTVILAILAMQIHKLRMQFAFVPYPDEQDADEHLPKDVIDVLTEQSEFEERIARFQAEMNSPTYEDKVAPILHPGTYNVPHDTVTDTPLRYKEEVAE